MIGAVLLAVAGLLLYRAFVAQKEPQATRPAADRTGAFSALDSSATPRARVPSSARGRRTDPPPVPGAVDPTLRLDLLAKVQGIAYQGTEHNIFQYHTPAPPVPKPAANPVTQPGKPDAAPAPAPTPIPLKYYGYAQKPTGQSKKAFFVDGEDIFIAGEGEIVNKRYKILKIGVNTVEVEDIVTKQKQTLPMQEA